jgi:serine protease Do
MANLLQNSQFETCGRSGVVPRKPLRLSEVALVVLFVLMPGCNRAHFPGPGDVSPIDETDARVLTALSNASQRVAQSALASVVKVEVEQVAGDRRTADTLAQLFGSDAIPARVGQGSGVVVDPDGFVLTNYHVVRDATNIWVTGDAPERLPARVVGVDALTDLALLKIDASDLPAISWGDSDALAVGALVWAVGSPYALERSVSFGILSAKDREGLTTSPYQDFLQTDAAINPGNSGGALVDRQGRLIGINTAVIGPSFQGIGFAIPAKTAQQVYERLRANGRVPRGWLGVTLDVVTPERAVQLRLAAPVGAYVAGVTRDANALSPAEQAGIRPGDVIVRWNEQPVVDPVGLSRLVARTPAGQSATAVVHRDGTSREIQVTVGEQPDR